MSQPRVGASQPPKSSASHTGWEQSEEVARRLLQDMAMAEARERAKHARDREYGSLVAEAHKHGVSVERPWEQEEEVYQRLHAELQLLEARGFPRVPSRGQLAPVRTAAAARPDFAAGIAPRHSPRATDEATGWEQDEEMFHRLADEMSALEARGVPRVNSAKWVPKSGMVKHSASEASLLQHPPWEQEVEVYQRLHDELLKLECRADERLAAQRRGEATQHPPLAEDKSAYDKLQAALRAMEAQGAAPSGLPRQMSRGSLLPWGNDSPPPIVRTGVHGLL